MGKNFPRRVNTDKDEESFHNPRDPLKHAHNDVFVQWLRVK
jgi:hypothetical protein